MWQTLLSFLKCDKMLSFFPENRMRVKCVQKILPKFKPKFYLVFIFLPLFYPHFYPFLPEWQQHCSNREGTVAQQAVVKLKSAKAAARIFPRTLPSRVK